MVNLLPMSAERPKWKNTLLAASVLVGGAVFEVSPQPQTERLDGKNSTVLVPELPAPSEEAEALLAELLWHINQVRGEQAAAELKTHQVLSEVSQFRASDMAARLYFSHYTPEGKTVFDFLNARGIKRDYRGEALCKPRVAYRNFVEGCTKAWLASPTHEKVIERPWFTHFGLGIADSEQGSRFIAVIFISTSE